MKSRTGESTIAGSEMTDRNLLNLWLAHYDPIHRGWTRAGIANGVCATNGFFFPRIRGGYNLYRQREGQPGVEPAGAAGADAVTARTFPWAAHEANARYHYRLAAISGGGLENLEEQSEARIVCDESGSWAGPRPNAPSDLRVTPAAGGRFVLQWAYDPEGQEVEPAGFRVYCGLGWSGVDYTQSAGSLPYTTIKLYFMFISEPFV
ncbi:MAG TPA: hypothetical protein VLM89_13085, partial [Phycisphaerae bacterium]|nr:hypothetical protein [Phycisphaerae bacterium]